MTQWHLNGISNGLNFAQTGAVDEGGVALAAIQGLNRKLEAQLKERDARIEELERHLAELKTLVTGLAAGNAPAARGQEPPGNR